MALSIEQQRANVIAHDQAEAEKRREEALKPVQPTLDAIKALAEPIAALQELHTPELLQADQDLWERLRVWLQVSQNLQNGANRTEAALTVSAPIPLTGNTGPA